MHFLRDISISRKLKLVIMLTTSIALLVACTAFVTNDSIGLRQGMTRDLAMLADILVTDDTAALMFNDPDVAAEDLNALSANPHIISACYYNKDGELFTKYVRADQDSAFSLPAIKPDGTYWEKDRLVVFRRVVLDGETIGALYIESDLREKSERLRRYFWIVAVIILASLGAAYLLSSGLQRVISGPISHLAGTARAVCVEKDYTIRAVRTSGDEMGMLIDGFNEMLSQIQERDTQLQEARDKLERRVEERTKELQQEIAERKQAVELLRRSEEHFRSLIENASDIITVVDLDGTIRYESPAVERVLGYKPEELVGRNVNEFSHPDDTTATSLLRTEPDDSSSGPVAVERRFKHKDGAWRTLEVSGRLLREESGRVQVVINSRDITQRKKHEHELLFANTLLNTEQETSLDGILVVGENREIISFNKRFVEMWGIAEEVLQSRSDDLALQSVLGSFESPDEFLDGLKYLYAHQEEKLHDELQLKDGRIFDRYSAPMIGADQNYYGRVFYFRDITEGKRAEQALRESEEVFRSLAETVSAAIYIYRGSRHVYLNPAAEIISGYTHDELMKMEVWDLVHPEFREKLKAQGGQRLAGELVPQRSETKILTKTGEVRWLDLTASLIQFHGEPAVLATAFDITERKGWEETLRESEEKYRTILESIQEGYFEVDLTGNLTFFNDSLCRIVGSPRERLLGLNNREYTDTETNQKLYAAFNQVYSSGEPVEEFQYEIVTRDGEQKFLETSILLRRDKAGQISGFRGTLRDITERKRSEEALKASETELRALFEAITDVIIVFDAQGCYRKIVPTNSASMYKPPDDLIGKTQHELFPKDKADFLVDCIGRALKEGRAQRIEYSLPLGETEVWFDGSVSPLSNDLVIWIARDITERKRAEAALRASEEQYRTLFERNLAGVYRATLDGKLLGCNDSAARILGYASSEEALSHSLWDFHDDPSERLSIVRRLVEERSLYNLEARCRSKNGDVVWVLANVSLLNGSSEPDAVIEGTLIDITARKQAEKEVVMLAHAVRSIQESVTITDNDGVALFANDAFLKTYGYDREEVIGESIPDLVGVASGSPNFTNALPPRNLSSRWEGDLFNRRKDGTEFPIHLSASPIRNDAGEPEALVGVSQDITEQRSAMAELQSAKEVAEAASRAKSEFLANMSHEIRTPMNGIIGMTELALDTELSAEQRDYLGMVKLSAESLLGVINDVLDFSKIEAGKLELDPAEFDLQDAVDEVMKTLAVRAEQKGLELAYYLRPGVPERVVGDAGRLRQVLVNLVGNAIKFTQHGEVIVRVEADARTSDEVVLHFGIRDTGIGVPPEKQSVIFESFTQADGSTTRKYGGTGLGLTISSQLVHMMDGEIWVESPVNLSTGYGTPGSLFHFTGTFGLPFDSGSPAHLPEMFDLAGLPVLVVDDNATNRKILEVQLESWQMKPALVDGGRSALRAIKRAASAGTPFKLALLDFHMPEMDGLELCEEIRKLPEGRDLRVIMMSSSVHANNDRSQGHLIDASLLKPVKAAELLSVIRTVLHTDGSSQTPRTRKGRKSANPSHILVAEDSAVNQVLIRRLLEKWGHTTVLAEDGLKALSLFDNERFDIALMDLQMPEMNGFEVTAAIREREKNALTRIPIIALTAHALKGDRERCIDAGMDDYISKPIDSEKLFDALETVAGQRERDFGTDGTGVKALDLDGLLRNVDGDAEMVLTLARIFEDSSLGQMQQIADALARGDAEALARGAHSVKGAVANFGARAAVDAAVRLEGIAKSEDLSLAGAAFGRLEKEIARLKLELRMLEQASLV